MNLKFKEKNIPISNNWINLNTGRKTVKDKKGFQYLDLSSQKGPKICGSQEDIEQFKILFPHYFENNTNQNITKRSLFSRFCCFFRDNVAMSNNDFGPSTQRIYHLNSNNIEDVPISATESLKYFGFYGLKTKARVEEVIDGDTLALSFIVKIKDLSEKKACGRGHNQFKSTALTSNNCNSNIIIKKKARLAEIDAAEHDTIQGQLATFYMKELFNKTNNYVYIDIIKMDKYERLVVKVYSDPEYNNCLNFHLIDKSYGKYGIIALKYNGDSKSDYMVNLSKMNPITIEMQNDCKNNGFDKNYQLPLKNEIINT